MSKVDKSAAGATIGCASGVIFESSSFILFPQLNLEKPSILRQAQDERLFCGTHRVTAPFALSSPLCGRVEGCG